MTDNTAQLHFALFTSPPQAALSSAAWRVPGNAAGYPFDRKEHLINLGRLAEAGGFDFVFAPDSNGIYSEFGGTFDSAVTHATQTPWFDASTVVTVVGATTEHVGVVATGSVYSGHPYALARRFATLDHLTAGRAGWNAVTSFHRNANENLGIETEDHETRYRRLDEYVDVVKALWDSWEPDAVLLDRAAARFADPSKVHHIDHDGEFYRSRGPLNVHRTPQGRPLVVQAGASPVGKRSVARNADVVFAHRGTPEGMRAYRDEIRRLAVEHGREENSIKVFFQVQPFVGETTEIGLAKRRLHNDLVPPASGLTHLSGHLGTDLSRYSPDDPIDRLADAIGSAGPVAAVLDYAAAQGLETLSIGDAGRLYGQSNLAPQIAGSPADLADWFEAAHDAIGGEGFILSPGWLPGTLADFVQLVIPELRRRGITRTVYPEGATLRSLVFDANP